MKKAKKTKKPLAVADGTDPRWKEGEIPELNAPLVPGMPDNYVEISEWSPRRRPARAASRAATATLLRQRPGGAKNTREYWVKLAPGGKLTPHESREVFVTVWGEPHNNTHVYDVRDANSSSAQPLYKHDHPSITEALAAIGYKFRIQGLNAVGDASATPTPASKIPTLAIVFGVVGASAIAAGLWAAFGSGSGAGVKLMPAGAPPPAPRPLTPGAAPAPVPASAAPAPRPAPATAATHAAAPAAHAGHAGGWHAAAPTASTPGAAPSAQPTMFQGGSSPSSVVDQPADNNDIPPTGAGIADSSPVQNVFVDRAPAEDSGILNKVTDLLGL